MEKYYYVNFLGTLCGHKHETFEAATQCAHETLEHLRENDPDRYERVLDGAQRLTAESFVRSRGGAPR